MRMERHWVGASHQRTQGPLSRALDEWGGGVEGLGFTVWASGGGGVHVCAMVSALAGAGREHTASHFPTLCHSLGHRKKQA